MTNMKNDISNRDRALILGLLQPGALECLDVERAKANVKTSQGVRLFNHVVSGDPLTFESDKALALDLRLLAESGKSLDSITPS